MIPERAVIIKTLHSFRTHIRQEWRGVSPRGLETRKATAKLVNTVEIGLERCAETNSSPSVILGVFFNEDFRDTSLWLLQNTENEELRLLLIKARMIVTDKGGLL